MSAVLPKGWIWTRIGKITENIEKVSPKNEPEAEFIYLDIASIDNRHLKIIEPKKYLGKNAPSRAKQKVKYGDVLFSTVRTYLKNIAQVPRIYDGQIASTGFSILRSSTGIDETFLFYYVQTEQFLNPLTDIQRGTSYPAVRDGDVREQFFPLPPLAEQRRIVAKIEELFTKLDAGAESLKKAKAELKRYRQSVLKHAFEGKLTETWRKAHKSELEPASVLLERIKEERKKKLGGKYNEPVTPDTIDMPKLPEIWCWARFDTVCNKIQDGSHFSPKNQYNTSRAGTYLYITAKNIKENGMDLSEVTYVDSAFHKSIYGRCNPEKGDVLLTKDGAKTGIAVVNNLDKEFSLLSSVALFKSNKNILKSYYLKHFLNSPIGFKMTTGQMTGTAIKRIILEKIRTSYIPLPPIAEQHRIVAEIEHRFSIVEEVEKTVEQSLKESGRLRQSILKRAFEGKLVPQDPKDEPAQLLLERIRAHKKGQS